MVGDSLLYFRRRPMTSVLSSSTYEPYRVAPRLACVLLYLHTARGHDLADGVA